MLKPFWNKKRRLSMTGDEFEAALSKADTLPVVSAADAGRVLVVDETGAIVPGEAGGDDAIDELIDGSISIYSGSVTQIRAAAFSTCRSLKTVIAPECTFIGSSAFSSCSLLESVSFPKCTEINSAAFYECSALSVLSLPGLSIVGFNAFFNDNYIRELYLPNVQMISYSQNFRGMYRLVSLYLLSTSMVSFGTNYALTNYFSSTPIMGYTNFTDGQEGYIYVPSSLLSAYQNESRWSGLSSKFVGV